MRRLWLRDLLKEALILFPGGTDNHLMLVDLRPFDITGKELEHRLDEVYITVNKNAIPNDPQKPFVTSGLRIVLPPLRQEVLKKRKWRRLPNISILQLRILIIRRTLSVRA